ncbi:MAG: PhoH family protein [Verrucomicrobia bacterium]|nr:PhoH family protein [Kiritimatiellia bacterium]MCP5487047.1 PhoH family protein [Verrucomicrobiota bacterium]
MEATFRFDNPREAQELLGARQEAVPVIETKLGGTLVSRDTWVTITGEEPTVERTTAFLELLREARNRGISLREQSVGFLLDAFVDGKEDDLRKMFRTRIEVGPGKPPIFPRTFGQMQYFEAMRTHDCVLAVGPAGTGKTYQAMAMAVSSLVRGDVSRIILTRPAVEAGESLGFLPGDAQQKVFPYLRPLYDALYAMMNNELIEEYLAKSMIEIAPLAYMRGRTLSRAFVILDEGQNTTPEQMFMFLTRLGVDSRCVVTGDLTQIDLPAHKTSGLIEARNNLKGVKGVATMELNETDVVRHPLVQRIIQAYRRHRQAGANP